ncbi:MAG TPA: iron ABC transporter permease [Candidatus Omnitrophota bacterium]|nr:iron ABC transporter permease [Candidatus Omnitrophota bacterium]HPT07578.1 iron ABC transporter permease [Candidatus Omnitrophota bacterium]
MDQRLRRIVAVLSVILCAVIFIAVVKGSVTIPFMQLLDHDKSAILHLRLMRILIAVVAGIGLSVSGIVLQAILRNPLAEPYLLGTSSGAGLGAVIALMVGLSRIYMPAAAFGGAIASVLLVYNLAQQNNKVKQDSLILSGVVVSVVLSAVIVFLISISGTVLLHEVTWWLWGSFQVYDPVLLFVVASIVLLGTAALYFFAQDLNALSLGEEEAVHLGVDIEFVRKILIAIVALITASVVCMCGIIGFVGLIVPHAMRLLVGSNHKVLIPVTCIASAVFMVLCDTLSRVIMPPVEIPIGVITAILGAPAFIILLKCKSRQ